MSHKLNSEIAVIGIDIGKNSLHVVGCDDRGTIMLRQKTPAALVLDRKKLAAFSAAAARFLLFSFGDRRCNRTRASVGNAGGNARPSLTNATLATSRLLHRRSPTRGEAHKREVQADGFANKLKSR